MYNPVIKTRVRKIGTSFGVLLPKKIIEENQIKNKQDIELILLRKNKIKTIEKAFGITKEAKPFQRSEEDRW
jgi:antitoxin component of MazEF toxin-antitoxin module